MEERVGIKGNWLCESTLYVSGITYLDSHKYLSVFYLYKILTANDLVNFDFTIIYVRITIYWRDNL